MSDPYRWLEDGTDPEVRAWMDAQDLRARAHLASLPDRERLRARFAELLYVDWVSAPVRRGGRSFFLRRSARQEKAVLCVAPRDGDEERVLVDPGARGESLSLGAWSPSRDGRLLAYALRPNAADSATLHVLDVATGVDLEIDRIADAKYASPSWLPDSSGFFYTWLPTDPAIPRAEVPGRAEIRFHPLGSDPACDPVIHPATGDPRAFLGVDVSRDGRWLVIDIQHGWTRTDVYFKELGVPVAPAPNPAGSVAESLGFTPLAVGVDAQYGVVAWEGFFYVVTNEGAPRFRVLRVDPRSPAREHWVEIVPEGEATLEGLRIVGGRLALHYLRNAASELAIRELDGSFVRRLELPGVGATGGLIGEPDDDEAFYSFTSFTQVPQIYRTSIESGAASLWRTIEIPADTSGFVSRQVVYRSKDGTPVSMFLVHRRDLVRDGRAPALLTGYGGFAVNLTPSYRSSAVVWVEGGGVLAVPNLRGGGEYGEEWHRAGMLANKQNVFDDFIAAAEWLAREGYSRPERTATLGGSNGGLLVAAAMVQRPELFGAVVCAVPLLDMVRYERFGSGATWVQEYGTANDPESFRVLHAYSPYHGVTPGARYPALLLLSADSDDRVDPMHARKFAAAVQHAAAGGRPVLLRIERNAGHTGADLVRELVEQQADQFAFLWSELGLAGDRSSG